MRPGTRLVQTMFTTAVVTNLEDCDQLGLKFARYSAWLLCHSWFWDRRCRREILRQFEVY